ncbi:MAG TPA: hypothetical protein VD905_03280 [Flavobacteriales bacterium]|nr:hypothetical protein [Flavobacteriales bacterium]
MKSFYFLVATFFVSILAHAQEYTVSGIPVRFIVTDETFPESWKSESINAQGVSLDSSEIERSLELVKKAFSKYPESILQANLRAIYVLKSIAFYGQAFGGTNSSDVLYIANNGRQSAYSDNYIEQTIHHEFSSILLRNFPDYFQKEKWLSYNKIEYGDGGVEALKTAKSSQVLDTALHVHGFLHQYASSDMENDFNSFAENIFLPELEFYDVVSTYPAIAGKFEIIISFYNALDELFTKKYFKKIEPARVKN